MSHYEHKPPEPHASPEPHEPHERAGAAGRTTGPERRRRPAVTTAVAVLVTAALAGLVSCQSGGDTADDRPRATASTPKSPTTPAGGPAGGGTGHTAEGRLAGKVVVIDPGHNPGNFRHTAEINRLVDVGTHRKECDTTGTAAADGATEAAFTRDVSQRLRVLLEGEGAEVVLTHEAGARAYGPCIDERARVGNEAKADAVVSVHADGSAVGHRGFHVILPAKVSSGAADTTAIVAPSRTLGERIADAFALSTGARRANYLGGGTGLHVRTDLGGLNLSTVPKVFIECGNMADPEDAALLAAADWRQKAAQGLADGIGDFLRPPV